MSVFEWKVEEKPFLKIKVLFNSLSVKKKKSLIPGTTQLIFMYP